MTNRVKIIEKLAGILGNEKVLSDPYDMMVYESDGLPLEKMTPWAVVFPEDTDEVSAVVRELYKAGIPIVPRGMGTGLTGGCLPAEGGVVIAFTRMTKIIEVDPINRYAVVEPGVITQHISDRVKQHGLYYAPDPASGQACSIGGNIAENAGGPHCMKYGVTVNHILGVEMVLPDGEIITVGGKTIDSPGYDLTGVINASEGTFGLITKVIVKLIRLPESYTTFCVAFDSVEDATRSISSMLHVGITPAALEMIDGEYIQNLRSAYNLSYPEDAIAILYIELDGPEKGMETLKTRVVDICRRYNVRQIEIASNEEERAQLWKARKMAAASVGRISPNYFTQDGVVPRTKLPEILKIIYEVAQKYNVRIANAFHAGDGNIHPALMYDERIPGDLERVKKASEEILHGCVKLGGSISGEHGIGLEKNEFMTWIFNEHDLTCMKDLKEVFDPEWALNPGKIFPPSFINNYVKSK